MKHLEIAKTCDYARYSDILESLIYELNGVKILRLDFEADYQGYVDIDVLLENGSVFSYEYWYGSCSGCDDWEARKLDDDEIKSEMKEACTFFDNLQLYGNWRNNVNAK